MIKASKYFIPAALAIITLAGCGNEGNEPEVTGSNDSPAFSATIGDVHSRAFDQSWEHGDQIGISGCNRTNVCYHTGDGDGNFTVKKSGDQIYFLDDSEAAFTAFYPWTELAEGVSAIKADTRRQAEQKTFDFLWARGLGKKDAPNVAFKFAHSMVKVSLTVKPGTDVSYDEVKKARMSLEGFSHDGSFSVVDGTTAVDNVSDAWTFSDLAQDDEMQQTLTFSLIFFPQVLDNPLEFLAEFELPDGNPLSLNAAIDFTAANRAKDGAAARNEWVAGRQYNLSVTLHKTSITLSECVIKPWNVINGEPITVD